MKLGFFLYTGQGLKNLYFYAIVLFVINFSDGIFYIFIFLALYVQVFFFVTFLEKRTVLKQVRPKLVNYHPATFIIPCYNEEATVVKTIESIKALDYPQDLISIIVVNDGSKDSTWQEMQAYAHDNQVLLLNKENGGKHTALNYALPYVKTEFVCSFDADTSIVSNALTNAFTYFQEDKDLVALGGAVLIEEPKTFIQRAQSIEYQMFSFSKKMLGLLGGVLVVPGAFSMFKKEALEKVGAYRSGHLLEDLELTYRMQMAGLKVDHSHDAFVYTKGPKSLKALFKQRLRWSYGYINNTYDYRKAILNKKYGNFGMFTLPMTIIAYPAILQIFVLFWYNTINFFSDQYIQYQALGFGGITPSFSLDFFFIDTTLSSFLTILLFGTIFLGIYLGKEVSNIKRVSLRSIASFIIVYSMMVPVWTLTALYNTIFGKKVSWGR